MLNNITYVNPKTPSLFTMMTMGNDSLNPNVYGPQTAQHLLNHGDVLDLMVINFDANAHPFHLHGFSYQLTRRTCRSLRFPTCSPRSRSLFSPRSRSLFSLAVAMDVTSDDPALNPPHTLGAKNPMRRDTIIIPAGGAVNLAVRADNPGAWILCVAACVFPPPRAKSDLNARCAQPLPQYATSPSSSDGPLKADLLDLLFLPPSLFSQSNGSSAFSTS